MPCINPITILSPESRFLRKCRKENRSFEYYRLHSNERRNLLYDPIPLCDTPQEYYDTSAWFPRVMSVPCGKCELCRKSLVDSYFIRNYFQYLETNLANNGSSWLITLTYADDILPKTIPYDPETGAQIPNKIVPCFSKKHIQTFLKRFRKYSGLKFKYFFVCEYGGEVGRPHYHAIFHIDDFAKSDTNRLKLIDLLAKSWTKINDRKMYYSMPEYGLFDMQRVDATNIYNSIGIRYVCKYLAKQMDATEFECLEVEEDCKMFHLQSVGLGSRIYDYCNTDLWDKGTITLDGYNYAIPSYYKEKIMREYFCESENGSIIYRPSDYKLQYFEHLCRKQFEEHKNLAILNKGYPRPPVWCYDPEALELVYQYIGDYITFRDPLPNGYADTDLVVQYLNEWNDYLYEVQEYNKSQFDAQAKKYKKQREDYFLKKTHRK